MIYSMDLVDITKSYFKFFSNKDLLNLKKLFAENISLRDWQLHAKGIDEVVEANQKIFENVKSIIVTLENIYQDGFVVISEIQILINNSDSIKVIDIIKFNKNNKIVEISAYKQ